MTLEKGYYLIVSNGHRAGSGTDATITFKYGSSANVTELVNDTLRWYCIDYTRTRFALIKVSSSTTLTISNNGEYKYHTVYKIS